MGATLRGGQQQRQLVKTSPKPVFFNILSGRLGAAPGGFLSPRSGAKRPTSRLDSSIEAACAAATLRRMNAPFFAPLRPGFASRALACWLALATTAPLHAANWPHWRGPTGDGVCAEKSLPVKWSATENVKWRLPLPEPGNSTPIVWGNKVFLTQPDGKAGKHQLLCLDRATGKQLWKTEVNFAGKEPTHGTNPYSSASPATDGERVVVSFASAGLWCYDLNGKELWHRDLGQQAHIWGNAASPVLHGGLCFLNFGPGARSFLVAVDKQTGQTVWQNDESGGDYGEKKPDGKQAWVGSWTTPVFIQENGRESLLMSWPGRVCALEPKTGKQVWECKGINPLVYTSPLHRDGMVVAMGGFGGKSLAVRTGGRGDVTESHRLWLHPRTKQRIGSGVIHDGHIYIHNDPGVAECFELKTGQTVWEERLKGAASNGQNWSSIMLAGGNCYTITQGGDCFVFQASPQFELVSVNSLGEPSNSSVVPSDGELFIRTHRSLWCIAEKK